MRKIVAILALSTVALTACGGGSDDDAEAAATTAAGAKTETTAVATTAAPTTAAPTTAAPTTAAKAPATTAAAGGGAAAPATLEAVLTEWKIEAPTAVKAGKVSFNVRNGGQFAHELVIYKGTYASLPKAANGSVDEAKLPAGALVGRVEKFDGGKSATGSFDLTPGQYTYVCNLAGGGNSHAARGQVLDFTVS